MAREKLTDDAWCETIRRIYTDAADGIIALQNKLGWYKRNLLPVYEEKWDEIRKILQEVPSSAELTGYLASVGLDIAEFENMYGAEKIQDAILYAKDLKDRYSVLWVAYDLQTT